MKEDSVRNIVGQARTEEIIGIKREDIKAEVLTGLCIGNTYMLKSGKTEKTEKMKLVELSKNVAVFETKNGIKESFTYAELYVQNIG
ncbi:MAG: hypothetical protein ACI4TK_05095 [Agathobacter sp.]